MSDNASHESPVRSRIPNVDWRRMKERDSPTLAEELLRANDDRIAGLDIARSVTGADNSEIATKVERNIIDRISAGLQGPDDVAAVNELLGLPLETEIDRTERAWAKYTNNVVDLHIAASMGLTLRELREHLIQTAKEARTAECPPELFERIWAEVQTSSEQ